MCFQFTRMNPIQTEVVGNHVGLVAARGMYVFVVASLLLFRIEEMYLLLLRMHMLYSMLSKQFTHTTHHMELIRGLCYFKSVELNGEFV